MKKESKELFKFISGILISIKEELLKGCVKKGDLTEVKISVKVPFEEELFEGSLKLIERLPSIETLLKSGGFIPDENNTPCKSGDKIVYKDWSGIKKEGTLIWSPTFRMFLVRHNNIESSLDNLTFWRVK